jgi:hypothetical protein
MRGSVHRHRNGITRLKENCAWSSEFAHKAFTGCQVADNPARRNTLERVFAIPRHEVSVVDDVLLAFAELAITKRSVLCLGFWHEKMGGTHVFANDGTQTLDPQDASTAELADEETFAGEHGLAKALRLVVLDNASRARQESVFASAPDLFTGQSDVCDVAE